MDEKEIKSLIKQAVIDAKNSSGNVVVASPIPAQKKKLAKVVNFDSKSLYNLKDNISDWSNKDFAIHIKKMYFDKYGEEWLPTVINIQLYLNNVKEVLHDILGFCDNISFKDYLEYFFSNLSDSFKERGKGNLYLNSFKDKKPVEEFVSVYNYADRSKHYLGKTLAKEDFLKIDSSRMEQSYLLGAENFVSEFGVILTVNFLKIHQNFGAKDAINYVAKAAYSLYIKNKWNKVEESTLRHSPYPDWLEFKKYDLILGAISKKINKPLSFDVAFSNNKKGDYDFLRSAKNG